VQGHHSPEVSSFVSLDRPVWYGMVVFNVPLDTL